MAVWQIAIQKLAAMRPFAFVLSQVLHRVDEPIFRLTQGRSTLTSLLSGLPVVLLTTTGARSGQARSVPLLALLDGQAVILAATSWGQPHNPGWYHNLKANPEAIVNLRGQDIAVRAREASTEETRNYWRLFLEMYPGYQAYRRQAGDRSIPVMILSPASTRNDSGTTAQ